MYKEGQWSLIWFLGSSLICQTLCAGRLEVSAHLAESRIRLGEPVAVDIELRNTGEHDLQGSADVCQVPRVMVSRDGEKFLDFNPSGLIVGGKLVRATDCSVRVGKQPILKPGQSRHFRQVILFSPDNIFQVDGFGRYFVFPVPGEYFIKVACGDIASGAVAVTVIQPDAAEAAVWAKLREIKTYGPLIQTPSEVIQEELVRSAFRSAPDPEAALQDYVDSVLLPKAADCIAFSEIIRDHPTSVYSHHLALALGRRFLTTPNGRPQAAGLFEKAATMTQVPWVREQAFLEWARMEGGEKAVVICDHALKNFPNGRLRPQFEDLRVAWQKELAFQAAQKRPEDGGLRAERELRTLGYDLDNLTEEQIWTISRQIEAGTWDECEQRSLSNEECDALLYRRYKEWATKNLKPTLPPTTNDTSPLTAPVEP